MDSNTVLYIIELFWDRQKYDAARFSLNATSLYFTCIANGKSRMYHSGDMKALVQQAGLIVEQDTDNIGEGNHPPTIKNFFQSLNFAHCIHLQPSFI